MTDEHDGVAGRPRPPVEKHRQVADRRGRRGKPLLPAETSDEADLVTPLPDDWYDQERPPHHT